MIYVIRDRESNHESNCLSQYGIDRCNDIVNTFSYMERLSIYTCLPKRNFIQNDDFPHYSTTIQYIKPLQTASNVCSKLDKHLKFIQTKDDFPPIRDGTNYLIIWHRDVTQIINQYFYNTNFIWKDDEYDGCLILDKYNWEFIPTFIQKNKLKEFCKMIFEWLTQKFD